MSSKLGGKKIDIVIKPKNFLSDEDIIYYYKRGELYNPNGPVCVYGIDANFYVDNDPKEVQNVIDLFLDDLGIKEVIKIQQKRIKEARRLLFNEESILNNMFSNPEFTKGEIMKKHSHHNVRLDDYTKRVLVAASEKTAIKQAEIVRELILAKFPEIAKKELFK